MSDAEVSPTPPRKGWRRALLVLAVGPGAVMFLSVLENQLDLDFDHKEVVTAFLACLGGLWGLSAGILKRSLLRAILGLHCGALLAILWAKIAIELKDEWMMSGILAIEGAILGVVLNVRRTRLLPTFLEGAVAGCVGIGSIAALSLLQEPLIRSLPYETRRWLFIPLISVLPLCIGLYFFFWLIADVLPRREAARERVEPPFDPPVDSA